MRLNRKVRGGILHLRDRWQLSLLIALLLLLVPLIASADEALTQSYLAQGNYAIVAAGVGLFDPLTPMGDITLEVPGTPIQAFLYWAGNDGDPGGDNTITLSINGDPPITLVADRVYGPDFWFSEPPDIYNYVYAEDITSLVLPGTNIYTVSDYGPIRHKYGAGLIVVYEDSAIQTSIVEIVDGLDSTYWGFPDPRGPNTDVVCFQFSAVSTERDMSFTLLVGGIATDELRPNAIWYMTGTGTLPGDLVNQPGAVEIGGQPLNSNDGDEWDTYNDTITVPAGATFACLQIESIGDQPPLSGASLIWLAAGVSITVDTPIPTITSTSTSTASPTVTSSISPTTTATSILTPTIQPTTTPSITSTPSSEATPSRLPETGFTPWRTTSLQQQPAEKNYHDLGDLWLEIPYLNIEMPILGVPIQGGSWDVTWLSYQAGYLEGTAFPTFSGNTALTGHVLLSDGSHGPFFYLSELHWGDEIILHAYGQRYIYEVREVEMVKPNDLSVLRHEEHDWLTLITCHGFDRQQENYGGRLAVRAVRLEVIQP